MKYCIILSLFLSTSFASTADHVYKSTSEALIKTSNIIDKFLSRDQTELEYNPTKMTFTFPFLIREGRGPYLHPNVDLRLALPRTEEKIQLTITSEEKDIKEDPKSLIKTQASEKRTEGGLSYNLKNPGLNITTSAGMILELPSQPFYKINMSKDLDIGSKVINTIFFFKNELKWINTEGVVNDTDLDIQKKINPTFRLKIKNNILWNDQNYITRFQNGPTLYHHYSETIKLQYDAHAITLNQPELAIDDYLVQVIMTKNLYKGWLYSQIGPIITFPREMNFHRQLNFLVQLQIKVKEL